MSKPLRSVLFSISVNSGTDKAGGKKEEKKEGDELSYNTIKGLIEGLGGSVCATVHKKVDYLVASSSAVRGATQRVRKAEKLKVPVVSADYIQQVHMKKIAPNAVEPFIYSIESIAERIREYRESMKEISEISNGILHTSGNDVQVSGTSSYEMPSLTMKEAIECSCICHDRGKKSCNWCESVHTAVDEFAHEIMSNISKGKRRNKEEDSQEKRHKKRKKKSK